MYVWKSLLALNGLTLEEGARTRPWAATVSEAKSGKFYLPIGKQDDGGQHGSDPKTNDDLGRWMEKELVANGGGRVEKWSFVDAVSTKPTCLLMQDLCCWNGWGLTTRL